jgi:3-oxoacyl-[acyl-carrier protein] reductase
MIPSPEANAVAAIRAQEASMGSPVDLTGRVALVTGASRGIGKAVVLALAAAGAVVAVNCRERERDAQGVADAVRALGRRSIVLRADVSSGGEVAAMLKAIESGLGPVDVLVNNAGIALRRGLDDLSEADFDRTIAVNLKSAFLCTQAVLPGMRARRWGRIVNISSGAARGAGIVGVHYNASKAGMEGLTRGYAARLVKDGITVNAVAPSLIETEMVPAPAETAARVPLGRLGLPEEVAQAVLMVIGNAYMTGQTIPVNGGLHFN